MSNKKGYSEAAAKTPVIKDEILHLTHEELVEMHELSRLPYAAVCVNISDDRILDSIIQSAAALGCEVVYVYSKNTTRRDFAAEGVKAFQAVEHISIDSIKDSEKLDDEDAYEVVLQCLEYFGYTPFGLVEGGVDIGTVDFTEINSPCIVMGDDYTGLPAYLKERLPLISIMPTGIIRSVDIASAAAIAMSHIQRQYVPPASLFESHNDDSGY